jgi:hypothetical protein
MFCMTQINCLLYKKCGPVSPPTFCSKLLQKGQGTHWSAGSVSVVQPYRVVLLWCTQIVAFIEVPVDNVITQGYNVPLSEHPFVKNLLRQKCWGSTKWSHLSTFERFSTLCHTLQSTPRPYYKKKLQIACAQFEHSSLLSSGRIVTIHTKSCDNQGCSLTFFFWVVYKMRLISTTFSTMGGSDMWPRV